MNDAAVTLETRCNGLEESFTFGKVALQANGSVWYRCKKAVLIATATIDEEPTEEPFLPLTVQYIEKSYAAAKIPGGFVKREMKPGDFETLTARIIDRSLRPLFPETFRYPVTITVLVVSSDPEVDLQVAALHAASAALYVSDIPVTQTVAGVRVAKIAEELVYNPTLSELSESRLDLLVVGRTEGITMIEMRAVATDVIDDIEVDPVVSALDPVMSPAPLILEHQESNEADEHELVEIVAKANEKIVDACRTYEAKFHSCVKTPLELALPNLPYDESLYGYIRENFDEKVREALVSGAKKGRFEALRALQQEILQALRFLGKGVESTAVARTLEYVKRDMIREMILHEGVRVDGRRYDQIRPVSIETNILPSVHGSCLFRRGETQVLATATLGDKKDAQMFELLTDKGARSERFMLHYNFPGFSVGETKPIGPPSRRELGHGNLAKRALEPLVDKRHEGTIRLVSEVLESNGSSSMATVCAGALALRSADVVLSDLVAGVAMGLVVEGDKSVVLSDIMGLEDHDGDMDLKVAGTQKGITAMQMDIKRGALDSNILKRALLQAKKGREEILEKMYEAEGKIVRSQALPSTENFRIDPSKVGEIIGKAGSTIKEIIERFEVAIDLDRDDGKVKVTGSDPRKVKEARRHIETIATKQKEPAITFEPGKVYEGRVKRIVDFGVFVEIPGGSDALLHISKISKERVSDLKEKFHEGQAIQVVILEQKGNKIELATPEYLS